MCINNDCAEHLQLYVFKVAPGKFVLVVISHVINKIALTWLQNGKQEKRNMVECLT